VQRNQIASSTISTAFDQKSSGQWARSLNQSRHFAVLLLLLILFDASAEGLPSPQKKKQRGHVCSPILPYSGKQGRILALKSISGELKSIGGELKAKSEEH